MAQQGTGGPGSNLGSVYTGQEGFGKAFILGESDDSLKAYSDLLDDQAALDAAKQVGAAKAAAEKQTRQDKLKPEIPEHWNRYDKDIQDHTDKLFKLGADLMAAGIDDPMKSTVGAAQLFQKETDRLQKKAKLSMQYKDSWEKDRLKINEDKENKYTQESKDALVDWYDQSNLDERLDKGELPPRLMVADPKFELADFYGKLAGKVGENNPNPEDADLANIVNIAFSDPANAGFKEAIDTEMANIMKDPDQKQALEANATAAGLKPMEYLAMSQLRSYFGTEPLDINKLITSYLPVTDISGSKVEDAQGVTRSSESEYLKPEKLTAAAKAMVDFNPRIVADLKKSGAIKTSDEAYKYIEDLMKAQVQTKYKYGVDREEKGGYAGTGFDKEELDKDHDVWRQAAAGQLGETRAEKLKNKQLALDYINEVVTGKGTTIIGGYAPKLKQAGVFGTGLNWADVDENEAGSESDFSANKIVLLEQTDDEVTEKFMQNGKEVTVKKKVPKIKKEIYDLEYDGSENLFSPSKTNNLYVEGNKHQKKLFTEVMKDDRLVSYKDIKEQQRISENNVTGKNKPVFQSQAKKGTATTTETPTTGKFDNQ
jgi:hypothetical protein